MDVSGFAATAAILLFPAALIYAGLMDLFTMKIRNFLVGGIAGSYFLLAPAVGFSVQDIASSAAVAASVFVIAFLMFARGWIGGGDAKLAAATALWFAPSEALAYFYYASIFGGVLTLAVLQFRKIMLPSAVYRFPGVTQLHDRRSGIPYGVAMAAAALVVFPQTAWFAAAV